MSIIMKCLVCNKECNNLMGLSIHIKKVHGSTKEYYDEFLKKDNQDGKCIVCNKPTKYLGLGGYNLTCGYSCSSLYNQKEISRQSLIKYGTTHPLKSKEIRNKIEQTNFKKYGKTQIFQTDNFKNKAQNTWKMKYGVDNPHKNESIKQKCIKTIFEKYGVVSLHKSPIIRLKFYETMLKKYGFKHALQNSSLFHKFIKKSYSLKSYILPSKKEIFIQGYENQFLDNYFNTNQLENNLIIHPKNLNLLYEDDFGIKHIYYPDFLIINKNEIVEIKSWYTLEKDMNIDKKAQCVIQNGYNYRLFFPIEE